MLLRWGRYMPAHLATLLRERGLSLRDLARMAQVDPSTLWRITNRGVRPINRTAKRIADALGVKPSDVVELNGHDGGSVGDPAAPVPPAPTRP